MNHCRYSSIRLRKLSGISSHSTWQNRSDLVRFVRRLAQWHLLTLPSFFYWTEISDLGWPHERIHFIFRSLQFFFWVFKKNQYESPSSGQFSYNFKACSILGALKLLNWKVCIQKAFYYFITLALSETNNFGNPKRHSFQETSCWNIKVAFLN